MFDVIYDSRNLVVPARIPGTPGIHSTEAQNPLRVRERGITETTKNALEQKDKTSNNSAVMCAEIQLLVDDHKMGCLQYIPLAEVSRRSALVNVRAGSLDVENTIHWNWCLPLLLL